MVSLMLPRFLAPSSRRPEEAMRLVKVSMWELNDEEREDAAAAADTTDPERAALLRTLKNWRRTHHVPEIEDRDRTYTVLR